MTLETQFKHNATIFAHILYAIIGLRKTKQKNMKCVVYAAQGKIANQSSQENNDFHNETIYCKKKNHVEKILNINLFVCTCTYVFFSFFRSTAYAYNINTFII